MCDQTTYDHYPENVKTGGALATAEQMIAVDGNKKNIKMQIAAKTGKPVLLKSLHNIQTKSLNQKVSHTGDGLRELYDMLTAIPNVNVCFISDDDNELVGKFTMSLLLRICV